MKSHVVIRERKTGTEIPALSHVRITASSDSLDWQGLRLELGNNLGCDMDDVMVDGHYLIFNLDKTALHFETRKDSGWMKGLQPRQTFWINPEGRPFSIRHSQQNHWASVMIDGGFLDSIIGCHYELQAATSAEDAVLAHLMYTLVSRLQDHGNSSPELDQQLIRTFVFALATRHGKPAAELPMKGGIAPHQLNSLMRWLDEHIGASLTIDDMASKVGLSIAHFSREFKRSTGNTPWGYVVQLRLDRACRLLGTGESISSTAAKCGFSDHSHLSRLFKQRLGVSPITFARSKAQEHSRT